MLQAMRSSAKLIWWIVVILFVVVFIFSQSSGLTDRQVTRGTTVGKVNGEEVTYDAWQRQYQALSEQAQQQRGVALTQDELRRLENDAFDQIVDDVLLQRELDRRGIRVTDEEIIAEAQAAPPPWLAQQAELQTEGQFDPEKYQRLLRSPAARGQLRLAIEQYYRTEIPRRKLMDQIASGVYASDAQLWQIWRDGRDSAKVSYVALTPETIPDSAVAVTDAEISAYFQKHEKEFTTRPGRAVVSLIMIPRPITAADTAATRERALALRTEILNGAKFEDVVRRESVDSGSIEKGGAYDVARNGSFVQEFKDAAFALRPGEISQPVLTQFGFHIIKLDSLHKDTASVRHILLPIEMSDSSASRLARRADSLADLAAEKERPSVFDSAARRLQLPVGRAVAIEDEPVFWAGRRVPDVSAWAFGGAKVGETSQLVDAPEAYYLARLDSLAPGGKPTATSMHDDIRRQVARDKKLDQLIPKAQQVAQAVARGQTLEQAAMAAGLRVDTTPAFSRISMVPGLGRFTEAIGAAFALPVGAVSQPIKTPNSVVILRVDRRSLADRAAWEAQKKEQRAQVMDQLRRQRVQQFLANLREEARIENNVRTVQARLRARGS